MINTFKENENKIKQRVLELKEINNELDSYVEGNLTPALIKEFNNKTINQKLVESVKEHYKSELSRYEKRSGHLTLESSLQIIGYDEHKKGNVLIAYPIGLTTENTFQDDLDIESKSTLLIVPYENSELIENEYLKVSTYKDINKQIKENINLLNSFEKVVCYEIKFIFESKRFDEYRNLRNLLMKKSDKEQSKYYLTSSYEEDFVYKNFQNLGYVQIYDYRSIPEMNRFSPKSNVFFDALEELDSEMKAKEHYKEDGSIFIAYCDQEENQKKIMELASKNNLNPIFIPKLNLNEYQSKVKEDFLDGYLPDEHDLILFESIEGDYKFDSEYIKTAIVMSNDESETIMFMSRLNEDATLYRNKLPGCILI